MKKQELFSIQEWLPFEKILEKGIIQLKENQYIKIMKVIPINYHLKSDLEKEAILNSYKIFLKTCQFDLQILIQSNKEDLSKHISHIQNQIEKEQNNNISELANQYIHFIQEMNLIKKSSSKNFFILIKNSNCNIKQENQSFQERVIDELNENYFKIRECLSRCGNMVIEPESKQETIHILKSFFVSPIERREKVF